MSDHGLTTTSTPSDHGIDLTVLMTASADLVNVVVSGGSLTVTQNIHIVDTEGSAASDDLTAIVGGVVNQLLILRAANDARTVVVKKTGTLYLQEDFSLDSVYDTLTLLCIAAGSWVEISRANNG